VIRGISVNRLLSKKSSALVLGIVGILISGCENTASVDITSPDDDSVLTGTVPYDLTLELCIGLQGPWKPGGMGSISGTVYINGVASASWYESVYGGGSGEASVDVPITLTSYGSKVIRAESGNGKVDEITVTLNPPE
jgi:hypothetical protein